MVNCVFNFNAKNACFHYATSVILLSVCDPVLGDNGKLYVPKSLIPIYRNEIIPLSDVCTPNEFEAELLSGVKIQTDADAWEALQWFHDKGVKTAVLSSSTLGGAGHLTGFLSQKNGNENIGSCSIENNNSTQLRSKVKIMFDIRSIFQ